MKPILLLLLGFSGTGKSALASAIKRGERCLVDLPLPERIWSGTVVNASNSKCVYNIACANRENKPVLPIVKEGIGNADCMIMDPWHREGTWTAAERAVHIRPMGCWCGQSLRPQGD